MRAAVSTHLNHASDAGELCRELCPHLLRKKLGHGGERGFHALGECVVVRMATGRVRGRRGVGTLSVKLRVTRTLRLRPPRAQYTVQSPPSDKQPNHELRRTASPHVAKGARTCACNWLSPVQRDLEWMYRDGGQQHKCVLVCWSRSGRGITPARARGGAQAIA